MIMRELKQYIKERKHVQLDEVATHFNMAPSAIEGMLSLYVKKGKIREDKQPHCSGCTSCAKNEGSLFYSWVEK